MSLSKKTIQEIIEGYQSGEFSPKEVLTDVIQANKVKDGEIHANVTLMEEEAFSQGEESHQRISSGEARPLEGVPIVVKDNCNMIGYPTTASSNVLENYISPYHSTVVERLLNDGAIIFAKTNMDAFAHGSSTETSDFFTTKNPRDTRYLPGGSSGGSAASVAADMTIGAIGTETAGSIRQPAAWTGVVGFKPTYARVSRYGIIAMASSTDSPGPITKTVWDSAKMLSTIAGYDPKDATSSNTQTEAYHEGLDNFSLKGKVVGVPKEYFMDDMDEEVKTLVYEALKVYESAGATLKEISLMDPKYAISVYTIVQRSEVSSNLARFDGVRYGHTREMFGDEAKNRIMLGTYSLSAGYNDAFYKKAQQVRTLLIDDMRKALTTVDVIIAPTTPIPALPIGSSKESGIFGELMDVLVEQSSLAGNPGVNIPCGYTRERDDRNALPVGMQIIGDFFEEKKILQFAKAYENLTNWHKRRA